MTFDDNSRDLLVRMAGSTISIQDFYDVGGLDLYALSDGDPQGFGVALSDLLNGPAAADGLDFERRFRGVLDNLDAMSSWPTVVVAMMRHDSMHTDAIGNIAIEEWRAESWLDAIPLDVVSAGMTRAAAWASTLSRRIVQRVSAGADDDTAQRVENWLRLARLLESVAENQDVNAPLVRELGESFANQDWAGHDPWPAVAPFTDGQGRRLRVSQRQFESPYSELFGPDEPRMRRAISQADSLEEAIYRRLDQRDDLAGWLPQVGRALPGCGQYTCCRPGLFEAILQARGHRPRQWPELPPRFGAQDDRETKTR